MISTVHVPNFGSDLLDLYEIDDIYRQSNSRLEYIPEFLSTEGMY